MQPESRSAATASPLSDHETTCFIVKRFIDKAGDRGMSSDAMIALALAGRDGIPEGYNGPVPEDMSDLGRCCEAFKLAPHALRLRMLPVLAQWTNDVLAKTRERGW